MMSSIIKRVREQPENYTQFPGRVLRYISDGEVRSPFLSLKLVILDFF